MPEGRNSEARAVSLPLFSPNERATADDLNRLARGIRAPLRGVNAPRQALGLLSGGKVDVIQCIITANTNGNYITVQKWDGSNLGEELLVSKPYLIQQATLDGTTDLNGVSYTFTGIDALTALDMGSLVSEDWIVTLPYVIGSLIYAIGNIVGGIDNAENVDYIDLNIDARAWAKVQS